MRRCTSVGKHTKRMQTELEELWSQIVEWPPEIQQKVMDAIRAIQAEYIDGDSESF
jgi:hypothetical protein